MANLYTLANEYGDLISALEAAEDEAEAAEIWNRLDALEGSITDKAEAYARIVRNKQAEAEALKAEKQRLEKLQKAAERTSENLKSRLLDAMQRLNVGEIQTGIGKWKIQTNPYSVTVLDESAVPDEFRIPQPDKIDQKGILKHFRETGEILDGTEITRSESLRFR